MNCEGQLMTQAPPAKPNPGLFKRNPPIAGEAEAIEAAKNGDAEAFSRLYTLHKRRVYTLCLRMLGNVSEAEDMTQEAFLHLFRKLGSFRGESAFSTWLHRLTVNLVLMHLRKKGLNLVSLEETINPSEEDAPKRDFGSRDPVLAGSVDRVSLERAVASLPPGYRMVFVLHDVEGFEHNEIATMLDCSTGNSKSQLHKARLRLRELLRQSEPVAPARPVRGGRAMTLPGEINFDTLKPEEFEQYLPELFATGRRQGQQGPPPQEVPRRAPRLRRPRQRPRNHRRTPPAASSNPKTNPATRSGPTSRASSAKRPPTAPTASPPKKTRTTRTRPQGDRLILSPRIPLQPITPVVISSSG